MRRQKLHDDQRLLLVEMEDLRHLAGRARSLARQRVVFEEGALKRQRPALADKAHIGQGLLDDQAAFVAVDDEHQVEVAIADLADAPCGRIVSETGAQRLQPTQPRAQRFGIQRLERCGVHATPPVTEHGCGYGLDTPVLRL